MISNGCSWPELFRQWAELGDGVDDDLKLPPDDRRSFTHTTPAIS
jgi:hypothetical protein